MLTAVQVLLTAVDVGDKLQGGVDGLLGLIHTACDLQTIRVSQSHARGAGVPPEALIADAGDVGGRAQTSWGDTGAMSKIDAVFLNVSVVDDAEPNRTHSALWKLGPVIEVIDSQTPGEEAKTSQQTEKVLERSHCEEDRCQSKTDGGSEI